MMKPCRNCRNSVACAGLRRKAGKVLAQDGMGLPKAHFSQCVQLGTAAALKAELGQIKQVELALER